MLVIEVNGKKLETGRTFKAAKFFVGSTATLGISLASSTLRATAEILDGTRDILTK